MGEAIAELLGAVVEPVVDAVSGAIGLGGSVLEGAGEAASSVVEGVANVASGLPGTSTAARRESETTGPPRFPGQ